MNDQTQQSQASTSSLPAVTQGSQAPLVEGLGQGAPTLQSIQPAPVASGDVPKATEIRAKFAEEAHQYVRDYIRQADQKAAFFFAGATALIAFLYKSGLINMTRWHKPVLQMAFLDVWSLITGIALLICAVASILTVAPRLRGSKRGLIFFGAIAEFPSRNDYAIEIRTKPVDELIEATLMHVHDIAGICVNKFGMVTIGIYTGIVGTVSAIVLLMIS
ncbi:MAG: DUF5706 domain-containing protein [Kiritimatiellae bacterium]|nr:DUF5706 domain-containing protein [Kiritimatiellia bacterium]